jgi:hypothetical protein
MVINEIVPSLARTWTLPPGWPLKFHQIAEKKSSYVDILSLIQLSERFLHRAVFIPSANDKDIQKSWLFFYLFL